VQDPFSDENSPCAPQSLATGCPEYQEWTDGPALVADKSVEEILKAVEACRTCVENSRRLLNDISSRNFKGLRS
jgi:hypothetical protein